MIMRIEWADPLGSLQEDTLKAMDMMEAQALLMALDMLRESLPLYRAMEFQTDSMSALQVVREMISHPPVVGAFTEVIQFARGLEAVWFTHILRNGNTPAD
ncbi:hypothetical protein HPP92_017858 [Vanilla planifolia]|uniref:RNase H type-1 domain-containing protein n=1 Tax=Vanilla planifolia TaxID=51239 RepID=A0A835Q8R0_VANPL|nr:hypothetical protein HPP92_017858 [Vanilla planifolia]